MVCKHRGICLYVTNIETQWMPCKCKFCKWIAVYKYTITANTNVCCLSFFSPTQNVPVTVKSIRSSGISEHGSVHFTWRRAGTAAQLIQVVMHGRWAWELAGMASSRFTFWDTYIYIYHIAKLCLHNQELCFCLNAMWGPWESRIAWTCGQITSEKTTYCNHSIMQQEVEHGNLEKPWVFDSGKSG